jgi:hypothetical protein
MRAAQEAEIWAVGMEEAVEEVAKRHKVEQEEAAEEQPAKGTNKSSNK